MVLVGQSVEYRNQIELQRRRRNGPVRSAESDVPDSRIRCGFSFHGLIVKTLAGSFKGRFFFELTGFESRSGECLVSGWP